MSTMKRRIFSYLIVAGILLAIAGCVSSCSGEEGTILIKENVKAEQGGTVTTDDGNLSLEIPPGALPEDTDIIIDQVNEDEWPKAIRDLEPEGQVIRLEPDGLEFNEPVGVSIKLTSEETTDIKNEEGISEYTAYTLMSVGEDGEPEYLEETETHVFDDGSIAVSGQLSHFSWLVRTKSLLQVKLWEQEEPKQVDEVFETSYKLTNISSGDNKWLLFPFGVRPIKLFGFLLTNDFSITIYCCCSSFPKWAPKFPSVSFRAFFR